MGSYIGSKAQYPSMYNLRIGLKILLSNLSLLCRVLLERGGSRIPDFWVGDEVNPRPFFVLS